MWKGILGFLFFGEMAYAALFLRSCGHSGVGLLFQEAFWIRNTGPEPVLVTPVGHDKGSGPFLMGRYKESIHPLLEGRPPNHDIPLAPGELATFVYDGDAGHMTILAIRLPGRADAYGIVPSGTSRLVEIPASSAWQPLPAEVQALLSGS